MNEAQITSGTLSYAVGAGTAVISTPYWHAEELLADGRGLLFDFNDHEKLGSILLDLMGNTDKIARLRATANEYGKRLKWPKIGAKYINTAMLAAAKSTVGQKEKLTIPNPQILADFTLSHIMKFRNDKKIVQRAGYGIPNLNATN